MDSSCSMQVEGLNGLIILKPHQMIIHRKDLRKHKVIAIRAITSVNIKKPGTVLNGFIRFMLCTDKEEESPFFNPAKDENTVIFRRNQLNEFEALKAKIDAILLANC